MICQLQSRAKLVVLLPAWCMPAPLYSGQQLCTHLPHYSDTCPSLFIWS
jgi:hypothetical protein